MEASGIAELTHFHFNGGHLEVNSDMMRSRRAYALTRQETNSGAERIYGAEGFIFPPGRQLLAHAHTHNIWLFEVYSWGRLYVILDSFVTR